MLVDSHCHLNFPDFHNDLREVLKRGEDAGVLRFLTISTLFSDFPQILKLIEEHPLVYGSVGVHPHEVEGEREKGVLKFEDLFEATKHPKIIGIGETGLDYYYEHTDAKLQQESFKLHIKLAEKTQLPLIIHSRDAEEDILKCLNEEWGQGVRGVIHCFTGTKEFAEAVLLKGFYISISGILTFKKSEDLRAIVKDLPLERLLVETDSPYLAPTPYRGKRNEPAFVYETAKFLADLKQVSFEEIKRVTTKNFFNLFNKAKKC